jgi:hypothetical protein
MTDIEFMFDAALHLATRSLQDGQEVPPTVFLICDSKMFVLPPPPGVFDEENKERLAYLARVAAVAYGATASLFMSEIYVSHEAVGGKCKYAMPSDDPDRAEGVMMLAQVPHHISRFYDIVRFDNRKFHTLQPSEKVKPLDESKGDQVGGRFSHIITPSGAPPVIVAMAQAVMQRFSKTVPIIIPKP